MKIMTSRYKYTNLLFIVALLFVMYSEVTAKEENDPQDCKQYGKVANKEGWCMPALKLTGDLNIIFNIPETDCEYISGMTCRITYNGKLPLPSEVFFVQHDENGKKLNKEPLPYCDATLKGRDKFKLLLKVYLHKTGVLSANKIVFIGDGAPWIWNIIDEIREEMILNIEIVKVLDFYHATEHLCADVILTYPPTIGTIQALKM